MRARALLLAAALATAGGEGARACALELILAVDVSGSVDEREFDLQTGGIAAAFEHDSLVETVEGIEGGLLVTLTHWSGVSRQRQMTGWHHVTGRAGAAAFAAEVRSAGRAWRNFSTAIGEALAHAWSLSADAPMPCARRVVDVSGDGISNEGRAPAGVAAAMEAAGYTINGLVIRGAEPDPVAQYAEEVIAGPGAFVEVADSFEDYPRAILRKLLREIDPPQIVSGRAARPGFASGGRLPYIEGVPATGLWR